MTEIATVDQARERADRIRAGAVAVADWIAEVRHAFASRDWDALGYATWHEYLDGEFPEQRIQLPREERRELVGVMARAGMSSRAIAPVLGVDQKTVVNDRRVITRATGPSEEDSSDEPERVQSLDGRSRPATQPARPRPEPAPAADELAARRTPLPEPQPAPIPDPPTDEQLLDALDRRNPDAGIRARYDRDRLRSQWRKAYSELSALAYTLDVDALRDALDEDELRATVRDLRKALARFDGTADTQPGIRLVSGGTS